MIVCYGHIGFARFKWRHSDEALPLCAHSCSNHVSEISQTERRAQEIVCLQVFSCALINPGLFLFASFHIISLTKLFTPSQPITISPFSTLPSASVTSTPLTNCLTPFT